VSGHHIQTLDGELGHVEDSSLMMRLGRFVISSLTPINWWPGKKILVSPQWIERVSWGERKVFVNLNRETIKESPEYTKSRADARL